MFKKWLDNTVFQRRATWTDSGSTASVVSFRLCLYFIDQHTRKHLNRVEKRTHCCKHSFDTVNPPVLLHLIRNHSLPELILSVQLVFPRSEWRNPASPRTCSGCWSVACSLPMWLSMPGILGKNWGGHTQLCCALSARISDSCYSGLRPGRSDTS